MVILAAAWWGRAGPAGDVLEPGDGLGWEIGQGWSGVSGGTSERRSLL